MAENKKPINTIEQRLSDLESSVEGLLSTNITLTKMFTESHDAFMHEIARLKEEVAGIKNER